MTSAFVYGEDHTTKPAPVGCSGCHWLSELVRQLVAEKGELTRFLADARERIGSLEGCRYRQSAVIAELYAQIDLLSDLPGAAARLESFPHMEKGSS